MTTSTQTTTPAPEDSPSLSHISPLRTYCEIVCRSFWVTFVFVGLSTALIEQTGNGLPLASLGLIAFGCLVYSLFASAPFGVAAWIGTLGTRKVQRTFPHLQRGLEFAAVLFFAIAIFAPAQFGPLDGTELGRRTSSTIYIWDWFRFLGMLVLVAFIFRYALRKNFPLFRWTCVLAAVFSLYACVSNEFFGTAMKMEAKKTPLRQLESWNILGSEKNIIVILVDSFQGGIAEIALQEEALRKEYDDFVLFSHGVCPFGYTEHAVPVLLSGKTGGANHIPNSKRTAEDTFFHDAREAGYANYVFLTESLFRENYPHCAAFAPCSKNLASPIASESVVWAPSLLRHCIEVIKTFCDNGTTKILPIWASRSLMRKEHRWIAAAFSRRGTTSNGYTSKKIELGFLHDWANQLEIGDAKQSLLFAHNMSHHFPLGFDRQGNERVESKSLTVQDFADDAAYHLEVIAGICRRLKEKVAWDNTLLIILGDHGSRLDQIRGSHKSTQIISRELQRVSQYNAAILVKFPHSNHSLAVSEIPAASTDVRRLVDQYLAENDWTCVKPNMLEIPLDRENEFYIDVLMTHYIFRGGINALQLCLDKNQPLLRWMW